MTSPANIEPTISADIFGILRKISLMEPDSDGDIIIFADEHRRNETYEAICRIVGELSAQVPSPRLLERDADIVEDLASIIESSIVRHGLPLNRVEGTRDDAADILSVLSKHGVSTWNDVSSAPTDGTPFLATLEVQNQKTGVRWRETYVVWLDDETGEIKSDCDCGWDRISDFDAWAPIPAIDGSFPPNAIRSDPSAKILSDSFIRDCADHRISDALIGSMLRARLSAT